MPQRVETRSRRAWQRPLLVILAFAALLHVGVGWYFSDQIRSGALDIVQPSDTSYDVQVVSISNDRIELALEAGSIDAATSGTWGIAWPDGLGVAGHIVAISDDSVVREFTALTGLPSVGSLVNVDPFVFDDTPLAAHGIDFAEVRFPAPLGSFDAWHVPGDGENFVVFVHGKSGSSRESLRLIPALNEMGFDVFAISYRNDYEAPIDPSGFHRQGLTEWEDLAAAVDYVDSLDAENIAVMGSSMGGAITASFLLESPNADLVDAVVLDSPMLDFEATVDLQADRFRVPGTIRFVAKTLASLRFGVDWQASNYVDRAQRYETPMLVFHSSGDESVPASSSQDLAIARPDIVQLIDVEEAGHVRSWNFDPERYETELISFLNSTLS